MTDRNLLADLQAKAKLVSCPHARGSLFVETLPGYAGVCPDCERPVMYISDVQIEHILNEQLPPVSSTQE